MRDWTDVEVWRDVVDWPGYQISSHGRVKSFKADKDGRILQPHLNDSGYPMVSLVSGTGRRKWRVHRLVATAFLPNPLSLPEVRHLDDVRTNNHVANLAWGTRSDNAVDNVKNGNHNNARKDSCPKGHEYDWFHTRPNGRQVRGCTRCRDESDRARPWRGWGSR